jgi:hypothetical protein
MFLRPAGLCLAAIALASSGTARAECATSAAGQPYATGSAAASASASTVTTRRLGAERAAFLDALSKLKKCVGDKGKPITGWSLLAVRYFDSDPVVETDVGARFDDIPVVTALGSAAVSTAKSTKDEVRIDTTQAAVTIAQRNAKEALDIVFPVDAAGSVRQTLSGTLDRCVTSEASYWDDGAISVKLTCGKGLDPKQETVKKGQPAVLKHAAP